MHHRRILALLLSVAVASCTGADGLTGPAGPAGADGADGTDGTDGAPGADWPGPAPAGYTAADGILGGSAYSKWWVADADGSGTQPATTAGADFYRCKACHGWDGQGNAASYAARTGQSTLNANRPDVSSANLRATAISESYQELFDLIARPGARGIDAADNNHPDYDAVLTDAQIWNLVKFMREEWVAPSELYDIEVMGPVMYVDYTQNPPVVVAPTITYSNVGAKGNEANGQGIYTSACQSCHGVDGTSVDIEGHTLGWYTRNKPYETWFKAKFGEPGAMEPGLVTELSDLQDLYAALANATNFPG